MVINKSIIKLIIILLIFASSSFSHSYASETTETKINDIFNKSLKLLNYLNSIDRPIEHDKFAVDLIDYGVEIIKKAPQSFEAYIFTIKFRNASFSGSIEYLDKLDKLKDIYLKDIDNFEINLPEKFIMLLAIISPSGMYDSFRWSWQDKELNSKHFEIAIDTLKKISDYKDKDYAILSQISIIPGLSDTHSQDDIITKFPNHPFLPLVKLSKTDSYFFNGNYDEAIEYAVKLSEEYKGIKMPGGHDFEIECFEAACSACLAKKDFENAEKYLKLIEQGAPNSNIAAAARKRYERTKNPSPNAYKIDESSIKIFIEAQEEAKKKGIKIDNELFED